MAKIGWGEFVIILVIALLVLGPEKLPQAGRALGKAVRSVKKYIHEASKELEDIDGFKDIGADMEEIRNDLRDMGSNLEKSIEEETERMEKDIKKAADEIETAVNKEPEPEEPVQPEPDEMTAKEEIET